MRTYLVRLALLPVLAAVCGCGTVANCLGPREHPHYYGGVEYDYLALRATWSQHKTGFSRPAQPVKDLGEALGLTALAATDFPLSLVGDTLTLPSVFLGGGRGWDLDQGGPLGDSSQDRAAHSSGDSTHARIQK